MRHISALCRSAGVAALLLLAGCSVVVTPGHRGATSGWSVTQSQAVYLNRSLGLRAYPGARTLELREDGRHTRAVFETSAGLESVYGYFHDQLSASGWQRTGYRYKGPATKLEAAYARSGETLKLELDRQGKSGRTRLEIS